MPSVFLDAQGVGRSFGSRTLFEAVDLQVHDGDRLALVGRNGSGKSTLLRILAGEEVPDGGTVARHGTVAYLPQLVATPTRSAREAILARIGVAAAAADVEVDVRRVPGAHLGAPRECVVTVIQRTPTLAAPCCAYRADGGARHRAHVTFATFRRKKGSLWRQQVRT